MTLPIALALLVATVGLALAVHSALAAEKWKGRYELERGLHAFSKQALDQAYGVQRTMRDQHVEELERLHTQYGRAFERTVTTAMLGGVAPGSPAEVAKPPEDAELRARREIAEEVLARGVEQLRSAYRRHGVAMPSDEELRAEAEAIANRSGILASL